MRMIIDREFHNIVESICYYRSCLRMKIEEKVDQMNLSEVIDFDNISILVHH